MNLATIGRTFLAAALLFPLASAGAVEEKREDFEYTEAAKRMIPSERWEAGGQVLVVEEHEPVMAGAIAFRALTMLEAPVTATIAGAEWTYDPGVPLFMAEGFSGADSAGYPEGTAVFCQMQAIKPRDEAQGFTKKQARKRFEKEGTLCLVDHGNDGTFDQAIMSGIKAREFRASADIAPVAYTPDTDIRFPDSWVAIRFHHQNMFHSPRFYVEMTMFKRKVFLQGMSMDTDGDGALEIVPISVNTSKGELPKAISFGPARLTVLSIDSDRKTAEVRVESDWGDVPMAATGSQ